MVGAGRVDTVLVRDNLPELKRERKKVGFCKNKEAGLPRRLLWLQSGCRIGRPANELSRAFLEGSREGRDGY